MAGSATVKDVDKGYKNIRIKVQGLKNRGVKIGIMGDAGSAGGVSVVDYAMFNEFGTSRGIPARPFMGTTADRYSGETVKFVEKLVGDMLDGKSDIERALSVLGEWYQSKVQMTIREAKGWAAPNAPETIEQKGSSSPLIDTGRMVGAVRYEKL